MPDQAIHDMRQALVSAAPTGWEALLSVDLEERGRSDMILYYPRTNGHRSELVVLRNLGG